jgi:succinyl-CoA synthetase beta subunit
MNITGMLYGAPLLAHVEFPTSEVLGPGATEDEIQGMIDRHKLVFIKPLFKGGVGKKGKSGLIGKASDLKTALAEKERLYFAEHRHGNVVAKANGVTFESGIPAQHEVYFAISDSTEFRAPTMTLTMRSHPIFFSDGALDRLPCRHLQNFQRKKAPSTGLRLWMIG